MTIEDFLTNEYPRLWHLAHDAGVEAKKDGLPRECNLNETMRTPNGNVLKVYKSAWEQGWDFNEKLTNSYMKEFSRVEKVLNEMPLRPMTEDDI